MRQALFRFGRSFSAAGLLLGTLFFAASLTPSLVPRSFLLQGVLSGCSLAAGYGIGVFLRWLWSWLELPKFPPRVDLAIKLVVAAIFAVVAVRFLWKAAEWQNSIRSLMGMEPVDTAHPFKVGLIALAVFVVLIGIARLFNLVFGFLSRRIGGFASRPVANIVGAVIAVSLFWTIVDGVLLKAGLRVADSSFRTMDALVEDASARPTDPNKTGSEVSLIDWEGIGRAGRAFVAQGPTGDEIKTFLGRDAAEPLRVYAGLNSAETPEERAKLALAELKRVGGFDRSVLIVITPTGTGWVDPQAMNTVEYLHGGDVASVAIQYSYLASWLSLLVEPEYGNEAARALFTEVYGYWTTLPRDKRPRLYLYGLSLGALNSQRSADLFDVLGDPLQGALWSGPPFPSSMWNSVTRRREPGSPAWLPRFGNGSVVRFTAQKDALDIPGAEWGPLRIVYLQYASDAITFFEPASAYSEPAWMVGQRGPDVSSELHWYPLVTFFQLLLDVMTATTTPMGYGHVYAPQHYIDAWVEVTDVQGWTPEEIERLKRHFDR
ncbi:alpha/beta-hydrolase family protein [Mesorhizobium sp. LHD-90]|uniref:alpha/beta hydrolase n=1 Tax=Mesorhizobium sp. LHD-90 TaxID=3071414 RepID=UPI0027E181B3|nr:alpha/beta-hydrolase family protein [Mesorhizobium sp. LHD-90]MDQ6436030.1 alpha/beta-hydrolase family protein [Mesorhizobium sp. LHD-90]